MRMLISVIGVVLLIVFLLALPLWLGQWCCHNTELLASYYMGKTIEMPRFPFILGSYFTQCGLPYGIITEVWCHCIGVK